MPHEPPMRCCFCGLLPEAKEYVELVLRIEGTSERQFFGAHTRCLIDRLAPGFQLYLEPEEDPDAE